MEQTILVYDDDSTSLESFRRFFQKTGAVICVADQKSFEEALKNQPAVIFCDLILPTGSGLEDLKKAQVISPVSARVLVSGHLDSESLVQAINSDLVHRVLSKPWTIDQLQLVTAEAMAVHRILKERKYWEEVSLTDGLTHLWNRRGLHQHLVREVHRARRHHRPISLIMLDVDKFKSINDNSGHLKGDSALEKLAHLCVNSVRSIDWVSRYGGDEFVILLPETGPQEAVEVAERIRISISEQLGFTASLGVSHFPLHGQDPVNLLDAADKALYSAKTQGRNKTIVAEIPHEE